jgi:uncharacterized protein YegP (UPF0339 family)
MAAKYDSVYQIYKTKRGFHWRLRAPNNEIVARGGEPFKSVANVRRSIRRMRQYAVLGRIEVVQ